LTRKHLTGLLLAASTLALGTLSVVNAQDGQPAPAVPDAQELKLHAEEPTLIHAADGTHFKLDDEKAYPDADGFKSMQDRVSYVIGRNDGRQIPNSQPDLNVENFGKGVAKGLAEANEDYAIGYSRGFEITRRFLDQQGPDFNTQAFIEGVVAALNEKDSSLSIGYLIGNGYRDAKLDIQADSYLGGVTEGIATSKPPAEGQAPFKARLTDEQIQETLTALNVYMMNKQRDEAIAEGKAYIDGLKEEDGWKKTASGIAYKVVKAGEGTSPDENDIAVMDYEGSLLDGTVFDSSYQRGQTISFSAQQVIKGWGELLQIMKPGDIFEVVIPQDLAYGERGSQPSIPPYATLKFKMQMHSFQAVPNAAEVPAPLGQPAE